MFSIIFSILFARTISQPLRHFSEESKAISKLNVKKTEVRFKSRIKEVIELENAFEKMKTTLRSFLRFLPKQLIVDLVEKGAELKLGGVNHDNISIFFSDIENFTNLSEVMSPSALVLQLSEYFHAISEEICKEQGTLDKMIGDAVMCFWGAPTPMHDSAVRACRAAVRCQQRMIQLRQKWNSEKKPEFHCRIGIHFGSCVIGNIGSRYRLNYTAIGDSVNLSSRLEGLNKMYGTNIMISSDVLFQPEVMTTFAFRQIDRVGVKGKTKATVIFELIGFKREIDSSLVPNSILTRMKISEPYHTALNHYFEGEFQKAAHIFTDCILLDPSDLASTVMLERCKDFIQNPPKEWDGVCQYHTK